MKIKSISQINNMNMFNLMEKAMPPIQKREEKKQEIIESFDSLYHTEINKLKEKV